MSSTTFFCHKHFVQPFFVVFLQPDFYNKDIT